MRQTTSPPFRIPMSAPLTHSDYLLHNKPGLINGPEGVRHMLDQCKASGWKRVYWRCFDGGQATYKSKLVTPGLNIEWNHFYHPGTPEDQAVFEQFCPNLDPKVIERIDFVREQIDYGQLDSLAIAIEYGKQIGLEIHAWITINEDDHGWGIVSDFSRKYPECRWVRRNGEPYRSQLSFAFPEVAAYKLALIKEILAYNVDGLFLDWIRTGDVRDDPQNDETGSGDHGYEAPLIQSFIEKYGQNPHTLSNRDERWVRHRCEPQTEFMRNVRNLVNEQALHLPIAVLVNHPWSTRGMGHKIDGNLQGMHLDVKTWAREGLIDDAVASDYFHKGTGSPEQAFEALKEETEGKVRLWTFAWVPQDVEALDQILDRANRLCADQILFWEADYIEARDDVETLQAAMRAASV